MKGVQMYSASFDVLSRGRLYLRNICEDLMAFVNYYYYSNAYLHVKTYIPMNTLMYKLAFMQPPTYGYDHSDTIIEKRSITRVKFSNDIS